MSRWRTILGTIWKDAVWSKLIAETLKWIVGTTCVGVVVFLTPLRDFLLACFVSVWAWLSHGTQTPNWLLTVLVLICAWQARHAFIWVCGLFRSSPPVPEWRAYTSDIFDGIQWEWVVSDDGCPYSFRPLCPECDYEMTLCDVGHRAAPMPAAMCDNCKYSSGPFESVADGLDARARRMAERGIRKRGGPRVTNPYA